MAKVGEYPDGTISPSVKLLGVKSSGELERYSIQDITVGGVFSWEEDAHYVHLKDDTKKLKIGVYDVGDVGTDKILVINPTSKVIFGVDPVTVWNTGIYKLVSESDFVTLVTAANLSGDRTIIVVDEDVPVSANITLNSNITLKFVYNKKITVATGIAMTMNGFIDAAPTDHIFVYAGTGIVNGTPVTDTIYPEWFGAVRDGITNDLAPIRAAAALIRSRGGGVLKFQKGNYQCWGFISIYSNTIVEGAGIDVTILESATAPEDQEYIHITAIPAGTNYYRTGVFALGLSSGSGSGSTTHVIENVNSIQLRGFTLNCHDDDLGFPIGGSRTTIGILHSTRAYPETYAEDILVERVKVNESTVAVNLGNTNLGEGNPYTRSLAYNRNLTIRNCIVDGTSNKALEIYRTDGGVIKDNYIIDCGDGPQFITYNRNCIIDNNIIYYRGFGLTLTNGAENASVTNNICIKLNASGGSTGGPFAMLLSYQFVTTYGSTWDDYYLKHIVISNNKFIDIYSTNKYVFAIAPSYAVDPANLCYIQDIIVDNNIFDGNVVLTSARYVVTDISDLNFNGNRVLGDYRAVLNSPCSDVIIAGGSVNNAINITLGNGFNFNNVLFKDDVTIGAAVTNSTVVGCVFQTGKTLTVAGATNYASSNTLDGVIANPVFSGNIIIDSVNDPIVSVRTIKKTIGTPGDTGVDFTWTANANADAQNLDLGAIVPAKARVIAVEIVCTETVTSSGGAVDITMRAGNASAGEQFIVSLSCDDINEVVGIINAALPAAVIMNWSAATNIWIGGDPDQNWDTLTAGKWSVHVTYIQNV